jgi:hypothetical protein
MPPGPPGWGPGGPRRPNNNGAVVIVIIAVFVVLIGGGAIIWLASGGDSKKDRTISAPSAPGLPSVPGFTPPAVPSFTPPSFPSYTPYSPPDTYSPPPQHWGAIAVAHDGSVGKAWDYDTSSEAQRRAINECPRTGCKVLVTFVNSCGAIAYNSRTNRYWGGRGSTQSAAQRDAISNAGGGRWITWVCTTR